MTFFERKWAPGSKTRYTDTELPVGSDRTIGFGSIGHTPNRTATETVLHVLTPDKVQIATYVHGRPPGDPLNRRELQEAAMNRSRVHTKTGARVVWKPTPKR